MSSRYGTTPCVSCGKPIKVDAAKCWFCGSVFDTEPCTYCDRPIKRGSSHCQFCARPVPRPDNYSSRFADREDDPRPLDDHLATAPGVRVASDDDRREDSLPPSSFRECPRCGEVISRAAVDCKYCGALVSRRLEQRDWGGGGSHRPHRGGMILSMALMSYFVCTPLAIVALVMAILDIREMRAGRMDPNGEGVTWLGLVLAVFPTAILVILLGFLGLALLDGR